jgi:hypothetical protein
LGKAKTGNGGGGGGGATFIDGGGEMVFGDSFSFMIVLLLFISFKALYFC